MHSGSCRCAAIRVPPQVPPQNHPMVLSPAICPDCPSLQGATRIRGSTKPGAHTACTAYNAHCALYCARTSRCSCGAWRAQALVTLLPAVVVSGIPSISRAVMNRAKGGELQLFAEGFDFRVRCSRPSWRLYMPPGCPLSYRMAHRKSQLHTALHGPCQHRVCRLRLRSERTILHSGLRKALHARQRPIAAVATYSAPRCVSCWCRM